MKPEISVVMACYNEEREWVKESVDSILNQTFDNFEFIIVLDNPNNEVLKSYLKKVEESDKRVKLIINDKNKGLVYSLNKALNYSKGRYIARMDSDDISSAERLQVQYEYLEKNKDISLISSKAIIINENGVELYKTNDFGNTPEIAKKSLFYRDTFFHPSWMFRKEILEKLKGYNELPRTEDLDFLCRTIINGYKIINIPYYLIKYRIRENGISSSGALQQIRISRIIMKSYKEAITKNKEYKMDRDFDELFKLKEKDIQSYSKACKLYTSAIHNIRIKKYFRACIELVESICISKDKRMDLYNTIQLKRLR